MESMKCFAFWVLVVSSLCWGKESAFNERVRTQCGFTRFPTLCVQTLEKLGSNDPNLDLLYALVNTSMSQTNLPNSNFEVLSSHFISTQAQEARIAIGKRVSLVFFRYVNISYSLIICLRMMYIVLSGPVALLFN